MSEYNSSYSSKNLPTPPISTSVPIVPIPPANVTTSLGQTTPKEKIEIKKDTSSYYIKSSFMVTYILLLTTATITFIEAMRTQDPNIRHVLNLETCISIIAGYFYSVFLAQIDGFEKDNKHIDWDQLTKTRYIDWSITTPMMLLVLCIVLSMHLNIKIKITTILSVVLLNFCMLFVGYLGEIAVLSRTIATIGGFIPFFAMFYIIYLNFIKPKYVFFNYFFFGFYLVVWSLYGLVYLAPNNYKNIFMNVLDCISKCLIGLGLWVYYSNTISGNLRFP